MLCALLVSLVQVHWAKLETGKLENPQGATSRATALEIPTRTDRASRRISQFAAPVGLVFPESGARKYDTPLTKQVT